MKIIKILLALIATFNLVLAQSAKWISADDSNANNPNTWTAFRKDIELAKIPDSLKAKIAVDSKYWLWINGELVVFEGGLKRGPAPNKGYYDEVEIAKFLKRGKNQIAVLAWYFGKNGFSHNSSGKSGFYFELSGGEKIVSNSSWSSRLHPAYGTADNPPPNFRLSESNIKFNANKDIEGWQTADNLSGLGFKPSIELGEMGAAPWGEHEKRPIPLFKTFEIKEANFELKADGNYNIITAKLPYNLQMTPIISVASKNGGELVDIQTDHTYAASAINLRAEYITKKGSQTYESLGWLNGQNIIIKVPNTVKVESVKYRESGYDTEFTGEFSCDNEFYTRFWQKALRTLYVNMRDTFFDCPERERSQWWGDAVLLMSEAFYTLSPSSHGIMRKGIRELVSYQKEDGTLHSPIPGIFGKELPGQMCASVGKYGFWNYYMNTGDIETIKFAYPKVKKYLQLWKLDSTGIAAPRKVGWSWGDWGTDVDKRLVFAAWHSIALEGAANMADVLGFSDDAKEYREIMAKIKAGFNKYWNGKAYRHPSFKGITDDRVQALAVLAGIADESKYEAIYRQLLISSNASPYMEKYVMEALFKMGYPDFALSRAQLRFNPSVNDNKYTTLWEGWQVGGYGGGSTNHAWSGGALTVIAQYLCGLYPLEPAWKTFKIEPTPSLFGKASITAPTVSGNVKSAFEVDGDTFKMKISVPENTTAILYMPNFTDGKSVTINGESDIAKFADSSKFKRADKRSFKLSTGDYEIVAK